MTSHTVTVKMDDPKRVDDVVKALNDAGYVVKEQKLVAPEKKS